MRRFFSFFFHTLGVIFFLLICAGAYLWFADPFGMRPLLDSLKGTLLGCVERRVLILGYTLANLLAHDA